MRKTFNALDISKGVITSRVSEGDICIDATAGRGNDTAFLCELVGKSGKVTAFDIQSDAIESTRKLLSEKGLSDRAELVLDSHINMDKYADEGTVSCITFNFSAPVVLISSTAFSPEATIFFSTCFPSSILVPREPSSVLAVSTASASSVLIVFAFATLPSKLLFVFVDSSID